MDALKGISLLFRRSEFVAVLGPSGCGKTTLLNIIGGLDRYTSGELKIAGRSTAGFGERDWDTYRNHSVGFVFQDYNLIQHQTVLSNVELALTLSGVSKGERRRRAEEALKKVGLGDQLHKKPNQMSGGQMQRVAIARALINDPEIVLADEPTGALDSETSLQIMELLREVAKDRLVIMVTHNPDLASEYATRIIRLLDGRILSDSMPYAEEEEREETGDRDNGKKPSMSFLTALGLSFNNLLTKKARTVMVAFAGSIGIIGIALILSLSTGVKAYISGIEADALSSYPITIEATTADSTAVMEAMLGLRESRDAQVQEGIVTTNTILSQMYNMMVTSSTRENDLGSFISYIESEPRFEELTTAIQYSYLDAFYVYNIMGEPVRVFPSTLFSSMSGGMVSSSSFGLMSMTSANSARSEYWQELPGSREIWDAQYELAAGKWPEKDTDILLVIDRYSRISDMSLYSNGIKDQSTLKDQFMNVMNAQETPEAENLSFTYEELMDLDFMALPASAVFLYDPADGLYHDARAERAYWDAAAEKGIRLNVCGIVMQDEDSVSSVLSGSFLYTSALAEKMREGYDANGAIAAQLADTVHDVRNGLLLSDASDEAFLEVFDISLLSDAQQAVLNALDASQFVSTARKYAYLLFSSRSYQDAVGELGFRENDTPNLINIYPKDFNCKDEIVKLIKEYNDAARAQGNEGKAIRYTDYVSLLMSSVSTIVNAITWVLIAFVAISLVVSSIMIGVITYISVLERTKEIGILRAIGASRRDIRRVFNAETLVIGLCAGIIGILTAWLLTFPANAIVNDLAGIERVAILPEAGALILIIVSMALTVIAGLIPSGFAARRNPVESLRSE